MPPRAVSACRCQEHLTVSLPVSAAGFDGTLCIFSFQDAQSVSVMNKASLADKVIGSVKWPSFNSSQKCTSHCFRYLHYFCSSCSFVWLLLDVCVSCTTDDGCYAMLDTRSDMKAAAVMADTGKVDLFTHARYTDHHVLLGYGDGEIRQLDMRKPGEMSVTFTVAATVVRFDITHSTAHLLW